MTILVGVDEAGYGPNLGPLVVAASVWRIDADDDSDDAAARLARAGADIATAAALRTAPWGDSKKLHTSGAGLAGLERGVLASIAALDRGTVPPDGSALARLLGIDDSDAPREWPRFGARPLPVDAATGAVERLRDAIAGALPRHGVTLEGLAARVVHPARFNRLLDAGLNKSDILSRESLELAAGLRAARGGDRAIVWCDRHGGRKTYAPLVGRHFESVLVRALEECPARSRYAIAEGPGTEIEFTVGGEERVPVALASMTAKYVRELAMLAFNDHWGALLPGMAPTAGYPVDARRWLAAAGGTLAGAGIAIDTVWRRV